MSCNKYSLVEAALGIIKVFDAIFTGQQRWSGAGFVRAKRLDALEEQVADLSVQLRALTQSHQRTLWQRLFKRF